MQLRATPARQPAELSAGSAAKLQPWPMTVMLTAANTPKKRHLVRAGQQRREGRRLPTPATSRGDGDAGWDELVGVVSTGKTYQNQMAALAETTGPWRQPSHTCNAYESAIVRARNQ